MKLGHFCISCINAVFSFFFWGGGGGHSNSKTGAKDAKCRNFSSIQFNKISSVVINLYIWKQFQITTTTKSAPTGLCRNAFFEQFVLRKVCTLYKPQVYVYNSVYAVQIIHIVRPLSVQTSTSVEYR